MSRPILALDFGTYCGWAVRHTDGSVRSGCWDCRPRQGRTNGDRWLVFGENMRWTIHKYGIKQIAAERPIGYMKNASATEVLAAMHAFTEMFSELDHIPMWTINPMSLKKRAAGDGKADKATMTKVAKLAFPDQDIINDNQADALNVLMIFESEQVKR